MSAVATVLQPLETYTDEELDQLIVSVQDLLAKRRRERQEAARERARAILREAGLTSLDDRSSKNARPSPKPVGRRARA